MNQSLQEAVKVIKTAILKAQSEVLRNANTSLLSLYYGIGRYVSQNSREGTWGTGAIDAISRQLQSEMPGLHGFGSRNLKNMRSFYEFWSPLLNRQPTAADLNSNEIVPLETIRQPPSADFDFDTFLSVGFSGHVEIMAKVKDVEEYVYYLKAARNGHWTKVELREHLKADDYHHVGAFAKGTSPHRGDQEATRTAVIAMKIYAISDLHGRLEGLDPKGVDLVLVAGDFAPMHGWSAGDIDYQVCWINATLREWIGGYPNTQFRLIPGNHDLFAQNSNFLPDVRLPKNAKLLIDQADEVDGLRIYGTPWVPYINGSWAFEEMCPGQLREKFSAIPKDVDILLTHTPPKIRHKKIDVSIDRNTPHFGSAELLDAIMASHPRYALCGHIHTGDHEPIALKTNDGNEIILRNVSRLDEDYEIRYEPFVFDI